MRLAAGAALMTADLHATLFHPLKYSHLDLSERGACALFLSTEPGFRLPKEFEANLRIAQGFYPHFLALHEAGLSVEPVAAAANYDVALVLLGSHCGKSKARVKDALTRVKHGGLLVAAGAKNDATNHFLRAELWRSCRSTAAFPRIAAWCSSSAGPKAFLKTSSPRLIARRRDGGVSHGTRHVFL
jgi:16S rRNA (guanine1207-N2)-methyltransferase